MPLTPEEREAARKALASVRRSEPAAPRAMTIEDRSAARDTIRRSVAKQPARKITEPVVGVHRPNQFTRLEQREALKWLMSDKPLRENSFSDAEFDQACKEREAARQSIIKGWYLNKPHVLRWNLIHRALGLIAETLPNGEVRVEQHAKSNETTERTRILLLLLPDGKV